MSSAKPKPESTKPMKSSGGVSSSLTFGTKIVASTMPRTPMGMLMKKIQRQSK
jgi:hypothetical protein